MTTEIPRAITDQLLAVAPKAALVLGVALGGLVLASLAGRVAQWAVRKSGVEALAEKAGVAKVLYAVGFRRGAARMVGSLVWFAGLLLTLGAVADLLKLDAVSGVTSLAVKYLPRVLAAATMLLAGMSVAVLARNLITRLGSKGSELQDRGFAGQFAYYAILVVTVTLAADQAGLQTRIVESLIQIVAACGLAALALAFALGAREVFHNLTARHYYERTLHPGDHVSVGDDHGIVVRFTPIALVIRTDTGEKILPARRLMESTVSVRAPGDDADGPVGES